MITGIKRFNLQRWQLMLLAVLAMAMLVSYNQQKHRFDSVKQVTVNEAKAMIDAGALVIDVRSAELYQGRHIQGAINLPLAILQSGIPSSIASAIDKPVVVYCGDGVTTGPEGTQLLNQAGYKQAVNVKAGIAGWADAGLPIQK